MANDGRIDKPEKRYGDVGYNGWNGEIKYLFVHIACKGTIFLYIIGCEMAKNKKK